jgi:zinc transporter ZupT
MNTEQVDAEKPAAHLLTWLLFLLPLLLLGLILAYIVTTGAGMRELTGPPVEQLAVEHITLPQPGEIQVSVVNDGPDPVTVAQVAVDDAYWSFSAAPSATIPRLGRATFTIPYPWVQEELHAIKFVTALGMTFEGQIPAAVQSPQPTGLLFMRFGLLGLYVGIVPILLGMLWYPLLRRLGRATLNFVLCLTIGLLLYLAVSTWLDALEFAAELPIFWQGVPLVAFVALLTLCVLLATGSQRGAAPRTPLMIAYLIAFGIGLHNLGEGLAIGAAFSLGEAALGTFLVVGFTLHNITEGVGIIAPLTRRRPTLWHFALLALLAGGPAILGVWIGGFVFNPVAATIFLAIGVGAIVQVIWEVGKLVVNDAARHQVPALTWPNLAGVTLGLAVMYFTAFLVKF